MKQIETQSIEQLFAEADRKAKAILTLCECASQVDTVNSEDLVDKIHEAVAGVKKAFNVQDWELSK